MVYSDTKKIRLLVIDLEPAPYKFDLWNAFACRNEFEINVIYTMAKNWSPDGGHDFQKNPIAFFRYSTFRGKSIKDKLLALNASLRMLYKYRPNYIFISGYVDFVPLLTIVICILTGKKYFLHSDIFNCGNPSGFLPLFKRAVRNIIRWIIFHTASGVLVCGRWGKISALNAGCPEKKIVDFPYVFDIQRMLSDIPKEIPPICKEDLNQKAVIVLFCGRMIDRKGLSTLLNAVALINEKSEFVIWIEGEGPSLNKYKEDAKALGVKDRCRFIGFGQMDLHSWLIRNSDIVVVPSEQDAWGIVVDEGMQHGKTVISSDAVGSGIDRIRNGSNGLLFPKGDYETLSYLLKQVIIDKDYRNRLGREANKNQFVFSPIYNVNNLKKLLENSNSYI